jgi:hypothetical protein
MRNDANSVVIDLKGVHLLAQHLRRHIPRRSTRIQALLRLLRPRYSKIRQSKIPKLIKHQIFWFDIPVEYFLLVDELNRGQDTSNEELGLLLCELMAEPYLIPEISTRQQIHDKVKVIPVIECADHIGNERR